MKRVKEKHLSRRQFIRGAATAMGGLAAPYIIPATALGRGGKVAPSERIILGGMGIGNRGSHDLRWMLPEQDVQFVAICDDKKSSRENVKRIVDTRYGRVPVKFVGGFFRLLMVVATITCPTFYSPR